MYEKRVMGKRAKKERGIVDMSVDDNREISGKARNLGTRRE